MIKLYANYANYERKALKNLLQKCEFYRIAAIHKLRKTGWYRPIIMLEQHASSFTIPFFLISFSTCSFHVCFGLPPLLLTLNFKAFIITFSPSFLKTWSYLRILLALASYLKTPLRSICPSTPCCFFELIASHHTSLESLLFLFFSELPPLFLLSTMLHFCTTKLMLNNNADR